MSSLFNREALAHALAGGVGSVVSMTCFYPLEAGKGKGVGTAAAITDLARTSGVGSLYCGLGSTNGALFASNFATFFIFHALKVLRTRRRTNKTVSPFEGLLMGIIAAAVNVVMFNPLWIAALRIKLDADKPKSDVKYRGMMQSVLRIANEEGASSLWAGLGASLILTCSPAIQFSAYEKLRDIVVGRNAITAGQAFTLGATAKCISTVITYPLQVVQTRLRREGKVQTETNRPGILVLLLGPLERVGRSLFQTEGRRGLYGGLGTKLQQGIFVAAFQYLIYEELLKTMKTLTSVTPKRVRR